ncbi:MAG: 30S ribosomal protein S8 [Thermoleophilaceae bacterium]|nr:30S ribosomal protein S8 [Thermoleophilaceae bacterium]
MTDPIADFLTRIRNAQLVSHDELSVPASKTKAEIARVLKEQGYINDFKVVDNAIGAGQLINIKLRYDMQRRPAMAGLKRVSKPGRRIYVGSGEIPRILGGMGTTIISTSGGIMTGHEATKAGLGGELWAQVW